MPRCSFGKILEKFETFEDKARMRQAAFPAMVHWSTLGANMNVTGTSRTGGIAISLQRIGKKRLFFLQFPLIEYSLHS